MIQMEITMIIRGYTMKIWKEYEANIFKYFKYFNDELDRSDNNVLTDMSVISFNASGVTGKDDKISFILECSREIYLLVNDNNILNKYKFYLVVNKKIKDINSRIENYRKIWKSINKNFDIGSFNKGPEIKVDIEENHYFSSISEFNIERLSLALEIVSINPKLNTIIMSKCDNILTENYIDKIFHILFNCQAQYSNEIDYYGLSIQCCNKGDIAIRWGTSFEEVEAALIYNPSIVNISI